MNRLFYLSLCNCDPPPAAFELDDGRNSSVVNLNLKAACHQGFIDLNALVPKTNPFFDELSEKLTDDEEFRFKPPGLANDAEAKKGLSWRYGRIIARGILDQHFGYRWFPRIENLMKSPMNGWRAEKKGKGDTPDWLATKRGDAAVAEAKGVSRTITPKSKVLTKWRTQVQNVRIFKGSELRKVGGWIVAPRWVMAGERNKPVLYIEDPDTDGEREILGDELESIELLAGQVHTAQNLTRLGERLLAQKVMAESGIGERMPRASVLLWRCLVPSLERLRFMGRMICEPNACMPLPYQFLLGSMPLDEYRKLVERYLPLFLRESQRGMIFDGLELRVLKEFLHGSIPPRYDGDGDAPTLELDRWEDVSLLSDGSLLAPAELMVPDGYVEL